MRTLLLVALFALAGCRPGNSSGEADAQAVKRTVKNGEFIITAQKPDDMMIVDSGKGNTSVRTASGKNGEVAIIRTNEVFLITVRQALADGIGAWMSGQVLRDVFLVPTVNGKPDPLLIKAKSEKWRIEKIISYADNFGEVKGVKIYCPNRIEFRKSDGSRQVSEFPEQSCATALQDRAVNVILSN